MFYRDVKRRIRVGVQLWQGGTPDYATWRAAVLRAEAIGIGKPEQDVETNCSRIQCLHQSWKKDAANEYENILALETPRQSVSGTLGRSVPKLAHYLANRGGLRMSCW